MSTPATITQTRTLAELANRPDVEKHLWVRVQRSDGTVLEGELAGVEPTQLTVIDGAAHTPVCVAASELAALAVRTPHRLHEGMLAVVAIIGATAALVVYASFPWVRPGQGDITNGFMMLYSAAGALLPIALSRTRLGKWLTKWERLYPPGG